MKQLSLLAIVSLSLTLSCFAMDEAEYSPKTIPLSSVVTAIAIPARDFIVMGGYDGCKCFYKHFSKIIDPHEVFTIDANKKEGLVLVTNTHGLFVYNPNQDIKIWKNNTIPEKKYISAVFGPSKTILALNTKKQSVVIFDYINNQQKTYDLSSHESNIRNWTPTTLLSCNLTHYEPIEIACLDAEQRASITKLPNIVFASVSELSNPINIKKYKFAPTVLTLGNENTQTTNPSSRNQEVLYSPNGQFIAIANYGKGCTIWDHSNDTSYNIDEIYKPKSCASHLLVLSMAFHPNGCLALLCHGHTIKHFDIDTKKFITQQKLPFETLGMRYIRRLDFSPDGKEIAILGNTELCILSVPDEVIYQ